MKAAAETFRPNPKVDVLTAITELGVGEALVSCLDLKGVPAMVERALVCPPKSRLSPLTEEERRRVVGSSVIAGHYERSVERESACEILTQKAEQAAPTGTAGGQVMKEAPSETSKIMQAMVKSAAHAIGSQVGRQIIRGVLGSIFGKGRR